jgi:tetratricopeptide (TPR) repeat protein
MDSKLLAAGIAHHRSGDFQKAHEVYRQLLAANPQEAVVYNLLGAVCIDAGQLRDAGAYLAEALRLDPALAAAHDNLGLLLTAQDKLGEAIASFRRAVALEPRNAQTQWNLANTFLRSAQKAEAIEAFQQVVQLTPDNVRVRAELAELLCEQGRHVEALPHLRDLTRLTPHDARAHFALAAALAQAGQKDESIAAYQATIGLKPDSAEACVNLAGLYFDQELFGEAARWSRRALELRPGFAEAYRNLGCALSKQGKHEEAIDSLQTAVSLKPQMSDACHNLGVALVEGGKFEAAIEHYRHALLLHPADPQALYNMGNAYLTSGDVQAALEHYDRAIELRPDYGEAHHSRAGVWLLQGRLAEGFPEYEWRLRLRDYPSAPLAWPLWNGEPLAGRTLVLCSEQGLGDTLQSIRYAPLVKERGARVIVQCGAALRPILSLSPGVDALITPDEEFEADFCVRMMSIPHRLQTTLTTIPAKIPYVFADPRLAAAWQARLARWDGFKIGIVWQGNPQFPGDRQRSIPLMNYAPLAKVRGVRLVNLQKGPGREPLRAFAESWPVIDFGDAIDTSAGAFMDTAAIMKHLDLVITSDTAAAHLAGALGVDVWVALPTLPDWRWMFQGDSSPWYPTMRLFRQTRRDDWRGVFDRIVVALEQLASESR